MEPRDYSALKLIDFCGCNRLDKILSVIANGKETSNNL